MDKKYIFLIVIYLLSMLLGSQFLLLSLLIFVLALKNEIAIKDINFTKLIKWGIVGSIAVLVIQFINSFLFSSKSIHTESLIKESMINPFTILLIILVAPVLEELVFRKILFNTFKRKIGSLAAATISALLFSVIHFDFANTIIYVAMGLIFTWIYTKSKTIIAPILSHVVMNSVIFSILM